MERLFLTLTLYLKRGENLNSTWSKKFVQSVGTLSNEFTKTLDKLKELQPKAIDLFNESTALLDEESAFTIGEKESFISKYRSIIESEIAKYK
jgi:UDP-N-acetylmuramyl tripeptide synthase